MLLIDLFTFEQPILVDLCGSWVLWLIRGIGIMSLYFHSWAATGILTAGLRPGARRAILRPNRFSRPVTNSDAPEGVRWLRHGAVRCPYFQSERTRQQHATPKALLPDCPRCILGGKFKIMVGAEGFEPPTLCSQSRCDHFWKFVEKLSDNSCF